MSKEATETQVPKRHNYQDFTGEGKTASKSHLKLKALRLDRLPNARERRFPLENLSVLDLGCNEGFFCLEAVRQGASRVLGMDSNPQRVELARQNVPEAEFIRSSWWNTPDEKFDVILFLSAIHYEARQKALLSRLVGNLKPGGVLILECGTVGQQSARRWQPVRRRDGERRYPTDGLLLRDLLSEYAVRRMGDSVRQAGDPVPRKVFHCTPLCSTAIFVTGKSLDGKTTLVSQLAPAAIPSVATDGLLGRLLKDPNYEWRPLAKYLKEMVGSKKENWRLAGERIMEDEALLTEFCDLLVAEAPVEARVFIIEGELVRHKKVFNEIKARFAEKHIRSWVLQRG